ncbi:MAG TPA: DUF3810 family protein, partial [Vicinamibacterales bacterium]|nr:DUF3810 family protein [Vicinamibacterales bacterium]
MRKRTNVRRGLGLLALIALAIAAALVPLPPPLVERWYSGAAYPVIQRGLTPASSILPLALLDVAVLGLLVAAVAFVVRRWRAGGARTAVVDSIAGALRSAAVLYLVFLFLWGLNYRRMPLEEKLDYDASRLTPAAILRFGEVALERVNALHASSQRDAGTGAGAGLAAAFESAQR